MDLNDQEELSTNFGNDYSDHFLRTGVLPQAHIQNAANPLVGYPRLQKLHELKKAHTRKHACKPFMATTSLESLPLKLHDWASNNVQFDVVLVGGCFEETPSQDYLSSLPVGALTPRPSIALVWVPSFALETAKQALGSWGFRRSEDIVFLTASKSSCFYPPQSDADFIEKSSWHCLLGLKGTLRRSEDTDLINCNIDTDTVLESPTDCPNVIPDNVYKVIENFSLMSRRLHILPGTTRNSSAPSLPTRSRPGWVIVGPDCLVNNFNIDDYVREVKIVGTRVPIDPEIDSLRPKTPPRAKRNDK